MARNPSCSGCGELVMVGGCCLGQAAQDFVLESVKFSHPKSHPEENSIKASCTVEVSTVHASHCSLSRSLQNFKGSCELIHSFLEAKIWGFFFRRIRRSNLETTNDLESKKLQGIQTDRQIHRQRSCCTTQYHEKSYTTSAWLPSLFSRSTTTVCSSKPTHP